MAAMRLVFLLVLFFSIVIADENCYTYNEQHVVFDNNCIREQKSKSSKENVEPVRVRTSLPEVDPHAKTIQSPTQTTGQSERALLEEETEEYWRKVAEETLHTALTYEELNTNIAKNVIIFIGDGMGVPTITAARILKGQLNNQSGEEYQLEMDKLPFVGFSKTYNVDHQVPDSAGTATAYLSGVKTDYGMLGLNAKANYKDCETEEGNHVPSVLEQSHAEGKSVGIVTTTRLNHATPGASYAHSASRYWYDDTDLSQSAKDNNCVDIAQQLYNSLPNIEVALGGGRCYFKPSSFVDEEDSTVNYCRGDGQNLIEKWKINMENMNRKAEYVWNKKQLFDADIDHLDHLWDMDYDADANRENDPTLEEMTETAIKMLRKNDNGYFLLVEGGRIDHAHHGGNAYRSLYDALAMDNAIGRAVNITSEEDTLIIVTADHSHTFTLGAYGNRGNPILGLSPEIALDLKPQTVVGYGNGPGYQGYNDPDSRDRITEEEVGEKDYKQQTAVPLSSETHGGEDVAISARGPMAHLLNGVHEQNYIAHVMLYASCVGDNKDHCEGREVTSSGDITEPAVVNEDEPVNFLGNEMTESNTEAALYSMFSLEIVFFCVILGSGGYLIKAM